MKRQILASLLVGCWLSLAISTACGGEVLHNGIVLPDVWPPVLDDPQGKIDLDIPYLRNPPAEIPIHFGRQLFLDNFLIDHTTLVRTPHQPTVRDQPILYASEPWELDQESFAGPFSDGVWYDPQDQLYKMWYLSGWNRDPTVGTATAYAFSRDGVHFHKPRLDVEPGTNVVLRHTQGRDSNTVWMDIHSGDDARFKMFTTEWIYPGEGYPWGTVYRESPDGIHWSPPITTQTEYPAGDRTTHSYDPFRRVWVDGFRFAVYYPGREDYGRLRYYREHVAPEDLVDSLDELVWWIAADDRDPHGPTLTNAELYNLDVLPYESLQIGMFTIYQDTAVPGRDKINEVFVGYTRDGFYWDRTDRQVYVPVSDDPSSYRYGNVQSALGMTVQDDLLRFYFTGRNDSAINAGVAEMRRDGFVSLDAGETDGYVLTRPLRFTGDHLFVNLDAPQGTLRAEVLNADWSPIPGFSLADSIPASVDSTRTELLWKQGNLSALPDQPVRLRFQLQNGSLYSFWVSPTEAGASHGYLGTGGAGATGATDTTGADISVTTHLPVADTTVSALAPNTPHGGLEHSTLGYQQSILLKFDLNDVLANGKRVAADSVLNLWSLPGANASQQPVHLYLLSADQNNWVENQATWQQMANNTPWNDGGIDTNWQLVDHLSVAEDGISLLIPPAELNRWLARDQGKFTLALVMPNGTEDIQLGSRENPFDEPWLSVPTADGNIFVSESGKTGDWSLPGIWNPGTRTPYAGDRVTIRSDQNSRVLVSDFQSATHTTIENGSMTVTAEGTVHSPVTVRGGALQGNGVIIGDVDNASGLVAPGTNASLFTWTGVTEDWSTPTSWSPQTRPPGADDLARIEGDRHTTVTVTTDQAAANTAVHGGTLTVAEGVSFQSPIDLRDGALEGWGRVIGDVHNSAATVAPGTSAIVFTAAAGATADWSSPATWNPSARAPGVGDLVAIEGDPETTVLVSANQSAAVTTIDDGRLHVLAEGRLNSTVALLQGVMEGNGNIIGNVRNSGGIVSPGVGSRPLSDVASVKIVSEVPEPASSILLVVGTLFPALAARRR